MFWGLPVLGRSTEVHASRTRRCQGTTRSYPDLVLHHAGLPEHHRAEVMGIPVTSPARTVIDIARARPFRAGVVVADAALRYRICSKEDLMQVARECAAWPGVRRARRVAGFADGRSAFAPRVDLPGGLSRRGLPVPLLQAWITEAERVDFLWSRQRVIGEADGLTKYANEGRSLGREGAAGTPGGHGLRVRALGLGRGVHHGRTRSPIGCSGCSSADPARTCSTTHQRGWPGGARVRSFVRICAASGSPPTQPGA